MRERNPIDRVSDYYSRDPEREWTRFDRHPFEFPVTLHFLGTYLEPRSRVLDVGSGPGRYAIELSKLGFLEAVFAQRGERLRLDREALSSGEVFMGLQAVRLGLIDELGANSEAVHKAASMANLGQYKVVHVDSLVYADEPLEDPWLSYDRLQQLLRKGDSSWRQGLYYLYVEPQRRAQ